MARIFHVSESLSTGVISVISTLVTAQVEDGHEVYLIGSQIRSDTLPTWREAMPEGMKFIDFTMTREIAPINDLICAVKLRRLLNKFRPDILHLHSSKAGAIGRLAALKSAIPTFYQPHGLSFLRSDVSTFRRRVFSTLERVLALTGDKIIACSPGEASALASVAVDRQIALVNNGIPMNLLPARRKPVGIPKIGTCGRISPQKDPAFFEKVAEALRGVAELVWIGDGDESSKVGLLGAGVRVTGWLTRKQCLDEIAGLSIYIQTSAWEGMPISVIEAMAIGLPVVVTDIIGNRDLIKDTNAGFLISTPAEMVVALLRLIHSAEEYEEMAKAALLTSRQRYSSDAMLRALYQVYWPQKSQTAPIESEV